MDVRKVIQAYSPVAFTIPPYPFLVSRPGESHSRPTHLDGAFAGQDLSEILYFFHLSRTIGVFLGERATLRVRRDAWQ